MSKNTLSCIISVHGCIGAGKSTLLNYLKNNKNIVTIPEPVEDWKDGLDDLYSGKKRAAVNLQYIIYESMKKIYKTIKKILSEENKIILLERSAQDAAQIFMPLNSDQFDDKEEFDELTNKFMKLEQKINELCDKRVNIYLRVTDLSTLYSRVRYRGDKISEEYQKKLHEKHEKMYMKDSDNIIVIDNTNQVNNPMIENPAFNEVRQLITV